MQPFFVIFLIEMKTKTELLAQLEDYLASIDLQREPRNLYAPISYVLSMGGKRVRPLLMLLAYQLYKEDFENVLPAAAAVEVYHNFTLLHDDLMDEADVRRGKPTVHKKWDDNSAILSGDAMLILSYHLLAKSTDKNLKEVLDVFNQITLEVCDGQQFDIEFESREDVTESDYLNMIRLKTAVLLAGSMKMGAILGGASKQESQLLYDFGLNIGLAFQLQDDYLDVYGDPTVFGKENGGDIVSNKKTYMLIRAINLAEGETKKSLIEWINAKQFDEDKKIKAVTEIYNQLGIDKVCQAKMEEYYSKALTALEQLSFDSEKTSSLKELASSLMNRKL